MPGSFLNNYFGFNKQQRNGLFVLTVISFLLLLIRVCYPLFIKPGNIVLLNLPLIENKLDSSINTTRTFPKNKPSEQNTLHLFVFDPNKVTLGQLKLLGLKEKTAQIFIKYRNNGFVFKQKKDLQKVYGITDKLYSQLEPYILIDLQPVAQNFKKEEDQKPVSAPSSKQILKKIELNSADSFNLVALNGIGAGYAKRILKYRAILGGFTHLEQLKEVYGVSDELYEKISPYLYVEATTLKKINLNKDDFKVLNKHPYLTFEITKTIFDWRRKTSINSTNLKDLLNNEVLYQKLLPYLTFE